MDSVLCLWKNWICMKTNSLITHLVEVLRGELAAAKGGRLPSLTRLCRKYDVSLPTLRKAAHQLRDRGELTFSRGRAPRAPGLGPDLPPRPPPALDRIMAFVRESIASGDWPVGQALPKVLALARQFHASDHTVSTALALLQREGLIHRRGRGRYVGPPSSQATTERWTPPRFILVVQSRWNEWQGLCNSERTEQFAATFSREAERLGIELLPVIANETDAYALWRRAYLAGERAIIKHVKDHHQRYMGALLCRHVSSSSLDLTRWCRRLLEHRSPLVLFDAEPLAEPPEIRHPLFTRCGASESAVAACAVDALFRAGHRLVGYPLHPDVPWETRRLQLMRDAAAQQHQELTFVTHSMRDEQALSKPDRARIDERLHTVSELPGVDIPKQLADVLETHWASPWMGRLFADPSLTAIVAPNDVCARFVYEWLSALRVSLPDRFSLLSFDNSRSSKALPISSVDFGYGRLGYSAFHAILRTIPTPRDRTGTIYAKPFVAHRGSLGPAFHPNPTRRSSK